MNELDIFDPGHRERNEADRMERTTRIRSKLLVLIVHLPGVHGIGLTRSCSQATRATRSFSFSWNKAIAMVGKVNGTQTITRLTERLNG